MFTSDIKSKPLHLTIDLKQIFEINNDIGTSSDCLQRQLCSVASGTRTAYLSGAPEVIHGFSGVRAVRSLAFFVVFCTSLFSFRHFTFDLYCII